MSAPAARTYSAWEQYVGGDGLTVTLAAALALAVAWPIQQAQWVPNMPPATMVALLGLALAVVLARSGRSALRAHLLGAGAGAAVVVLSALAMTPATGVIDRGFSLARELDFWFGGVFTEELRGGVVEFGIFMLALLWALGFGAGWHALRRRQGWSSVLVGGLVLSLVLGNVSGGAALALAVFMGASVLLLIHMSTARRMVSWRARALSFEATVVLSQSAVVLLFGLGVVLVVSVLPTTRVTPLRVLAEGARGSVEAVEEQFTRLFNGLPSRLSYKTIVFEDETHFSGNPNLTDELLFTVEGDRGTYWRARTYTNYTGTGWDTLEEAEWVDVLDAEPSTGEKRVASQYFFRVRAATDTLFSGGLPVRFDRAAEALIAPDAPEDVLQVRYGEGREFFPTRTNLRYLSVASESFATPGDLRDAPAEYPDAVAETYLQLPLTLPERVYELARIVAGGEENPYDQAIALRDHVITFRYNLDIAAPPEDRDGVDYFLFDLRQGYCDYYASSMAVLLRTLGIPSRYVLGYASGRRQGGSGPFEVLDLNYHSWVEAYFPGYGWIPFEPTPPNAVEFGRGDTIVPPNVLDAPGLIAGLIADDDEDLDEFVGEFRPSGPPIVNGATILGVVGAVAALTLLAVWYRGWWSLRRLGLADEMYAKMLRLATLLGFPQRAHQTAYEYAAALGRQVPGHASDVDAIAQAYVRRRYRGRGVPLSDLRDAEEAWKRLRWALLARLFGSAPG